MKATYNENKEKKYEDKARELCGYDDAALLREAAAAEREWQQEIESHPERAEELKESDEANFEILMSRLNSEGLKPISERRYKRKQKWDNRDVTKVHKINRKVVVLVAVAALLVIGGSVGAMARNGYQYVLNPEQNGKIRLTKNGVAPKLYEDQIEEVYKTIRDEIGIPVLVLNYIPSEMYFSKMTVTKYFVIVEFEYQGNSIYLKESKPINTDVVSAIVSDRKNSREIHNYWLNKTINVDSNKLDNGQTEYSMSFIGTNGFYYLSGIMDENEFIKMVSDCMLQ